MDRLIPEQAVEKDDIRRLFTRLVHLPSAEVGGEPTRRQSCAGPVHGLAGSTPGPCTD